MSKKPIGGRGKKAPYKTVVIRVPEPLVKEVNTLIEEYRNSLLESGSNFLNDVSSDDIQESSLPSLEEAEKIAKKS